MKGERQLLRIGEYLISRACQRLPSEMRDERCREWTAELPAILRDPDVRLASHRAVRMLHYAIGTIRGAALAPGNGRRRLTVLMTALIGLFSINSLVLGVRSIWHAVNAPGDWVPYWGIASSILYLAVFSRILVRRIRRADEPMEAVKDAILAFGALSLPSWLLPRLLRVAGAEKSDLAGKTEAAGSSVTRSAERAIGAEQAISMARGTAAGFPVRKWRPAYRIDEVDEFIARIEVTLSGVVRPEQAVTAADVQAVTFNTTRRRGYDELAVDEALDHYTDGLASLPPYPRAPTAGY